MTKKDKQVPSYMKGDFLLYLMELIEKKKVRSKKEEGPYRTDVLYEPPIPIIDNSEEIDDEGNLIAIEPSNLPPVRK